MSFTLIENIFLLFQRHKCWRRSFILYSFYQFMELYQYWDIWNKNKSWKLNISVFRTNWFKIAFFGIESIHYCLRQYINIYHVFKVTRSVLLNNTIKPDHQYSMIFLCLHISVMFALEIRKQHFFFTKTRLLDFSCTKVFCLLNI